MKWLSDFMGQPVFALLGAIGLLSLVSGFLAIDEGIKDWLDAWKSITRPIWDFLLGWAFSLVDWTLPNWAKDYLTVGIIVHGMRIRAFRVATQHDAVIAGRFWSRYSERAKEIFRDTQRSRSVPEKLAALTSDVLFWPLAVGNDIAIYQPVILPKFKHLHPIDSTAAKARDMNWKSGKAFWIAYTTTLIWFAILIALNYALLFDWLKPA